MWDKLTIIYGRDKNVLRAKAERLRGNFNEMRMMESETIVHHCGQVKEMVNFIRG